MVNLSHLLDLLVERGKTDKRFARHFQYTLFLVKKKLYLRIKLIILNK